VALLGYSAYYAPGISVATMAEALLKDSHAVINCSAYCDGQYGAKDMFLCVPARLGAKGVEKIIELDLDAAEKAALEKSIASIRKNLENAAKLG
jgi:malate dehydrogenase